MKAAMSSFSLLYFLFILAKEVFKSLTAQNKIPTVLLMGNGLSLISLSHSIFLRALQHRHASVNTAPGL